MKSGLIFDTKRYAINDGPGVRLTIFFKGCPLHCAWCHNPESISPSIQKMYNADKCIGCRACIDACPVEACSTGPAGIVTDRERCTGCGTCADICPTLATEMSGKIVTVADLMEIVEKERIFFDQSGGGVTISGGEPLLQHEFLIELLTELGRRSIHRAVDTTGFCRSELLLEVARHTDLFLYDLKLMDSDRHKQWTGVENVKILENLKQLSATDVPINIRIPLIKGVNDDDDNMAESALFIASLPGSPKEVNLLPFHNIMANKYKRLGSSFTSGVMAEPDSGDLARIEKIFLSHALKIKVGG